MVRCMSDTSRTGLNTRDVVTYGFQILFSGAHCKFKSYGDAVGHTRFLQPLANYTISNVHGYHACSTYGGTTLNVGTICLFLASAAVTQNQTLTLTLNPNPNSAADAKNRLIVPTFIRFFFGVQYRISSFQTIKKNEKTVQTNKCQ